VISRVAVSLIMCTGGAQRPFLHDRHFSAASSFEIGVSRGREGFAPAKFEGTTRRRAACDDAEAGT
jgi:hypothetical protein